MKKIIYIEWENGSKCLAETGEEMEILEALSKKEFEKRFPEISTYGLEDYSPVYLENGTVLINTEWNGERYSGEYGEYRPVYQQEEDDFEIVGYELI